MISKVALLFSCASLGVWAQSAVHCAKLLDVKKGTYSTDVLILTDGEKIIDVGPAGQISVPAGVQRIEVKGTCLPGLIDVHDHLTGDPSHSGINRSASRFPVVPSPERKTPQRHCVPGSRPCAT